MRIKLNIPPTTQFVDDQDKVPVLAGPRQSDQVISYGRIIQVDGEYYLDIEDTELSMAYLKRADKTLALSVGFFREPKK